MAAAYEDYRNTTWLPLNENETPDAHLNTLIQGGAERVRQNIQSLMSGYAQGWSPKWWNPLHGLGRQHVPEASALLTFVRNFKTTGDEATDIHLLLTKLNETRENLLKTKNANPTGSFMGRLTWILKRELWSVQEGISYNLTPTDPNKTGLFENNLKSLRSKIQSTEMQHVR